MNTGKTNTCSTDAPKRRLQFRLRTLFYVVAVVSLLFGLYGAYQRLVLVPEQRRLAAEKFRFVTYAFFAESVGKERLLPAQYNGPHGDAPLHSWRPLLMRHVDPERRFAYSVWDPWTHANNASWKRWSNPYYCFANLNDPKRKFMTCMSVVTGPGTAFDKDRKKISELDPELILLVEVRNSGVHWMRPWDLNIATMPREINPIDGPGISGNLDGGFFVAFCDTTVWFLADDTPFEKLATFFTVDGAKQNDCEAILGPYKIAEYGEAHWYSE